jgi:hypothetical protein
MKLVGALSTAVLTLTLGIGVPLYAQQEQHDQQEENKDKTAQDKDKAQPEKSVKPEEKNARPENNVKPEEKNARQETNNKEEKSTQEQRTQQARPEQQAPHAGVNGGRIPDDHFKANFGQEHRFHVSQGDYNNRRFEYGGYSFGFVGAWPSNWLYTQDVYVVDINGVYYLCNASFPGVNIALSLTL